jgi:hypothetical protein
MSTAPVSSAKRNSQIVTALIGTLTVAGMALAVTKPDWLIGPLKTMIESAGIFGPVVYVVLVALAAPLHLSEVLVVLSAAIWDLPVAIGFSVIAGWLGAMLTAAVLARSAGGALAQRDNWPAFLRNLATRASKSPISTGLIARAAAGPGLAVEAFLMLSGYSKGQRWTVLFLGIPIWVAIRILDVYLIRFVMGISPWLLAVPPVAIWAYTQIKRRLQARTQKLPRAPQASSDAEFSEAM